MRTGERVALALLAALFVAIAWIPLRTLAPGVDEVAHVAAAFDLAHGGGNRLNPEHPPLMKRLAGTSMRLFAADRLPPWQPRIVDAGPWRLGYEMLVADAGHGVLIAAARAPFVLVGLVGLIACWWWARSLGGALAGLLAAALYALSPAVVAGASMVLNDFLLGVCALVACACAGAFRDRPAPAAAAGAGVASACACLAKFTGLMVPPLVLALLVAGRFGAPDPESRREREQALLLFFVALAVAFFVGVGLSQGLGEFRAGIRLVGQNHDPEHRFYALGEFSRSGFAYYFPLTVLLKATFVELLAAPALAGALALGLRRLAAPRDAAPWLALAAFPLAYVAVLMLMAPNYSHRYVTPLYPFLAVALAVFVARWRRPTGRRRVALAAALVLVQGVSLARSLPDPLTHFNGLLGCAGGRAFRCLDDANVDWGQNLTRIAPALRGVRADGETLNVAYLGMLPMEAYVPGPIRHLARADWDAPAPGLYVLGAWAIVRALAVDPTLADTPLYRAIDPDRSIGTSYLVVDLRTPP